MDSLPTAALVGVLQLTDVKHRLTSCAIVSKAWNAAAAAATDHVSTTNLEGCSSWVTQHGAHITSLHIPSASSANSFSTAEAGGVISQLPSPLLAHLAELRVDHNRLQLAPSSSGPGLLQHASSVKTLVLNECQVLDGQHGLSAIPSGLHALTLSSLWRNRHEVLKIPGQLLPALEHLTRLELRRFTDLGYEEALLHVAALTGLQHLHLSNFMLETDQQGFQQLQELQQLQTLILVNGKGDWTTANLPGLSKLTKLQRLQISNCGSLEPSMLQSIGSSRLQHLSLDGILWKSQPSDRPFTLPQLPFSTLSPWLRSLSELTHLVICAINTGPAQAQDVRALLASSKLCHLQLDDDGYQWAGVFTADQQLPHLTSLCITLRNGQEGPELAALVQCCPALQSLSINHSWDCDWDCESDPGNLATVDPLMQLRQLTALQLPYCDDAATTALAQMTQLVSLKLLQPCDVTDTGLLRLTALKRLTRLQVWQSSPGMALTLSNGQRLDSLTNQAAWDELPDVWAQLLQCCKRSPACQAVLAASALDQVHIGL